MKDLKIKEKNDAIGRIVLEEMTEPYDRSRVVRMTFMQINNEHVCRHLKRVISIYKKIIILVIRRLIYIN